MKSQAVQLSLFADYNDAPQRRRVVNVATVPQRSPFRYPGGKTWLAPIARQWFAQAKPGAHLIEPFAGGGIIGLTAAAEYQFERITLGWSAMMTWPLHGRPSSPVTANG